MLPYPVAPPTSPSLGLTSNALAGARTFFAVSPFHGLLDRRLGSTSCLVLTISVPVDGSTGPASNDENTSRIMVISCPLITETAKVWMQLRPPESQQPQADATSSPWQRAIPTC